MLTIFNRQELITIPSQQKFFRIHGALSAAGIPSAVKVRGRGSTTGGRLQGMIPPAVQDASLTYTIYVHRDDYHRAREVVQPALRGGGAYQ